MVGSIEDGEMKKAKTNSEISFKTIEI